MLRNLRSASGVSSAAAKKSTSAYFFSSTTSKGLKVVVAGAAGGIGQPLSMLLKIDLPKGSTLSLYDVANTPGVAADLSHINTAVKVEAHLGDMKDVNNVAARDAALKGADLVLIPAGVPRKPGMTRDDLFKTNAGIVKSLIEGVAKQCPGAFVGIITNPVNSTVPIAAEILKKHNVYDPKKLFGVSYLDVVRAETFVAETKGLDVATTPVEVIGGHSPETMIPILSKVTGATFTDAEAKTLAENVKNAGTAVVNAKGGAGSATLSMAYAAAKFAEAAVAALQGKPSKTIAFVDVKSLKATAPASYFGLTVEIGKEGVTKVHPLPKLNAYEEEQLKIAVPALEGNIKTGETFAKSN